MKKRKRKSRGWGLMGISTPAGGSVMSTLASTGVDMIVGGLGGGAVGAALGRWSLLGGLVATGAGHFLNVKLLSYFGVGMMASGYYTSGAAPVSGVDGPDDIMGLEGAKERVMAFGKGFAQKLFLDKVIPSLKDKPVSGLGEVQYFVYPDQDPVGELDMSALDRLEAQLKQSAQDYKDKASVSGLGEMAGMEGFYDDDPIY